MSPATPPTRSIRGICRLRPAELALTRWRARMRRWARRIGIGVATVAVLYVLLIGVGGGMALALALTPGFVDWSQSHQPVPKDPLEINYRGDPKTALGLDFETVHYDTELGPAEAWLVPAAAPSRIWAVFVHGIGGLRENGYR